MQLSLTVIILTFNESKHIVRCIKSIKNDVKEIIVIDSLSTDNTVELARNAGAIVVSHSWPGTQALQLNWALKNIVFKGDWIFRLDADEFATESLMKELRTKLPFVKKTVTGIELKRRVIFKGKWIRYGTYYPVWLLRIWRVNCAYCKQQLMDEHMVVKNGSIIKLKNEFVDDNLNNIYWWTQKHNNYARREAVEMLDLQYCFLRKDVNDGGSTNKQSVLKQLLKKHVYARLPLGIRPIFYFAYRFFIRFGFFDGPKGWIFHFLQGFWYRMIVDINVWEANQQIKINKRKPKEFIESEWKIKFSEINEEVLHGKS
jgi:glycosyltransferase involved in cell wall biosynthesis